MLCPTFINLNTVCFLCLQIKVTIPDVAMCPTTVFYSM